MINPPPLISCGTSQEEKERTLRKKRVQSILSKHLRGVAKETSKNHTMGVPRGSDYFFYRPHNYRLYVQFSRGSTFPKNPELFTQNKKHINTPIGQTMGGYGLINNGSEYTIKDWKGFNFRVKKKVIEVSPVALCKRWHKIDRSSINQTSGQMLSICEDIKRRCLSVVKDFIREFGGSSTFEVVRESSREHKILNDRVIDNIPRNERFDAPHVRKAYSESNVEFKSLDSTINYIENRTIESVAPRIASELELIRKSIMKSIKPRENLLSALESIKLDIKVFPDDVFKFQKEIESLSDSDRFSLSEWFFSEFGGVA